MSRKQVVRLTRNSVVSMPLNQLVSLRRKWVICYGGKSTRLLNVPKPLLDNLIVPLCCHGQWPTNNFFVTFPPWPVIDTK